MADTDEKSEELEETEDKDRGGVVRIRIPFFRATLTGKQVTQLVPWIGLCCALAVVGFAAVYIIREWNK